MLNFINKEFRKNMVTVYSNVYKHTFKAKVVYQSYFQLSVHNSPVQSRNTPHPMTTAQTTSLHMLNTFCICTYSFTLITLMNVSRPEDKIQCLKKVCYSVTVSK